MSFESRVASRCLLAVIVVGVMWCASGYAVAREGLKPLIAAAHQRDTDLAKLGYGE